MKIGIVTYHNALSYGAVLQAYALQLKLQQLGHNPYFIYNNIGDDHNYYDLRNWIGKSIFKSILKTIISIRKIIMRKRFNQFKKTYLVLDKRKFSSFQDLKIDPPAADIYICGSDQIWNYKINSSQEQLFWLDFGSVPKISYAASFGFSTIPENIFSRYSKYIKSFSNISVREQDAIKLVNQMGKSAVNVLDPTLLLNASDYENLILKKNPGYHYIFSYQLSEDIEYNKVVDFFGKNKSLKVNSLICTNLMLSKSFGPREWITKIKNSDFIITDSFHGLMFSLIYNKNFIVILLKNKSVEKNSRILSILEQLNLSQRSLDHFDEAIIENLYREPIAWERINILLNDKKEESLNYLKTSLKN